MSSSRTERRQLWPAISCSMVVKEVPKAASSKALMSSLCYNLIPRRVAFASVNSLQILLMHLLYSNSWVGFRIGVAIVSRRSSMTWILLCRLILTLAVVMLTDEVLKVVKFVASVSA